MRFRYLPGVTIAVACLAYASAQSRGFEVRDAIEMNTFSEPSALGPDSTAKMSPNQRYFLVVTSHGVIKTNQVESKLWLFNSATTRAFVKGTDGSAHVPEPRLLASVSAVPVVVSYEPYSPVISDVRWTRNSQSVFFLSQTSSGIRQLHKVDVRSGRVWNLTPAGNDVERYAFSNGTLVYTATQRKPVQQKYRKRLLPDTISVTGTPITKILFPQDQIQPRLHELWFIRNGHTHRVGGSSSRPLQPDLMHYWDVLSLSPDGRFVVQINPVPRVSKSWESYIPEVGREDWRIDPDNPKTISPSNIFRARQYVVTDLESGVQRPLINAPFADVLAYIESFQAVWSPDSERLLATNTFMPLDSVDSAERARRLQPCAAASVDITLGTVKCIVFTRNLPGQILNNPIELKLENASFGSTKDEVVLRLRAQPSQLIQTERYRYFSGSWKLTDLSTESEARSRKEEREAHGALLSVKVRQSLNDPPVLWATDLVTGNGREIWNPNPQFADMKFGEVSVYHWKDKMGFEWTGGLVKPVDYVPGKRYPLVIQTHGFADFAFMTDGLFPTAMAARPLASEGIAVLQVLGNSEHPQTLREAQDNILGYESAIEHLSLDGLVDPKRVGIVGFSRTSWYVESALIENPELFAAASINDGIDQSYMQTMLFDPDRTSEGQQIYNAKPFGEGLQMWARFAPSFRLDRVRTPVLITAIKPGGILEEWEMYSSLYQQKKPVDLLYIPDGQHILQKPLDRLASQQGNVDWFRFWLQNYERPRPEDSTEYMRWRKLRSLQGGKIEDGRRNNVSQ